MSDSKERSIPSEMDCMHDILAKVRYEDGLLYWVRAPTRCKPGSVVGSDKADGYRRIHWGGRRMIACHRLIFFMHNGWLPEIVDHIDGDTRNNRISNLRAATINQNAQNCKIPRSNSSGIKGVSFHKTSNRWAAYVRSGGKLRHLGLFDNLFEAACARKSAERLCYGEFAR